MKIAAHVLAFNVGRFLSAVLNNLEAHVDKVYIAYSEKPWGYVEASRISVTNPTKLSDIINLTKGNNKIEIIKGDWLTEEDMRNECLNRARFEGFDWLIVQDADEFYTDSSWEQVRRILLTNQHDNCFKTTWYNFWKSSYYVLKDYNGSIKGTNACFAVRCNSEINFFKKRLTNDKSIKVIDCPCYHYGYVMSDEEMAKKISTWGHANEFFKNTWYDYKWKNWTEDTLFLHPITPKHWYQAIRFPLEQPSFAHDFALPIEVAPTSWRDVLNMNLYNAEVEFDNLKKSVKKVIKSFR